MSTPDLREWGRREAARCDDGDPDIELCELDDVRFAAPLVERPIIDEAWTRGRWLLGLLVLQSTSSLILDSYQELLRNHLVVTLFLTMLVGAGGELVAWALARPCGCSSPQDTPPSIWY